MQRYTRIEFENRRKKIRDGKEKKGRGKVKEKDTILGRESGRKGEKE